MPFLVVGGKRLGGSQLQSAESAAVYVALDFEYPTDKLWIGHAHAYAPSGHVEALGHGVEFDTIVLSSLNLEK